MKKRNQLALYYKLFSFTVKDPRIMPSAIAVKMGKTGRGRAPSTFMRHIQNMYEKGISKEPQMTLKPYKGSQLTVYFCEKVTGSGLYSTFSDLHNDSKIEYVVVLSGRDFFLTSREKDLNLKKYDLEVVEESNLYTPAYTIPKGWDTPGNEALDAFIETDFTKGFIPRTVYEDLDWDDTDWLVYNCMKGNLRQKYIDVSRKTGVYVKTVKRHLYKKVLPNCVLINYFFPKGYDYYEKTILRLRTNYEFGIVTALQKLPCTTYVFPLENELILTLFSENATKVLQIVEKMEEKAIIDDSLLYNPIAHAF
jgi:hypothetical protein